MKRITETQRWRRNLGIIADHGILSKDELMVKYDCNSMVIYRVLKAHFKRRNVGAKAEENTKRYYTTEDEMIIQDYRIEDLTGDEKLILEKL